MKKLKQIFFGFHSSLLIIAALLFFPVAAIHAQPAFTTNRIVLPRPAPTVNRSLLLSHLPAGLNDRFNIYTFDAAHRVVTNAIDLKAPAAAMNLDRTKLQFLPVPAAARQTNTLSQARILMQYKIGVVVGEGANETVQWGDPFLRATESPLRWDSGLKVYTTTLEVGLDFGPTAGVGGLPSPALLTLFTQNSHVDTNLISINHAGAPYVPVTLRCSDPRTSPSVTVHYQEQVPDTTLTIPCVVEPAGLQIVPGDSNIFGFGLGTTSLTIRRVAKDGNDYADTSEAQILLTATGGKLDVGNSATIKANESSVEVTLRSTGLGAASISASYGATPPASQTINFIFPWPLILATLIGSGLGGVIRVFSHRKKNQPLKWSWLLQGFAIALIIVAGSSIGIMVFSIPAAVQGTEVATFVIASLCGYYGTVVLSWFKKPLTKS